MDRDRAIELLPEAYRRALHLQEQGAGDEEVAQHLGIPLEAVSSLFQIAQAKLDELLAGDREV
jgi:DNA-directed RNA polymerase specialized sigma24 family protein